MSLPRVTIASKAAQRVRNYDAWVFRDELDGPADGVPNGEVVELIDQHGTFVAYAFYSATAHVAARALGIDRAQPFDRTLLSQRLRAAIDRRQSIGGTNAKRLVFSEADGLPGLIVDQYADVLVLQIRTAGMERWKPDAVEQLRRLLRPRGILERSDKEFRQAEGLPPVTQILDGTVPDRVEIKEHGLRFFVDPHHGQKTGFYLDQRETRQLVRGLIRPGQRVADVFAYTAAFGIAAAAQGARVVCVEREESCLALGKAHAELNGVTEHIEWVNGDAFYWLEAKAKSRERFDWVLLDPASLAKTKSDTLKGRQALHHLVVNGLQLLEPQGTLALSVCTYHLLGIVEEVLRIAAGDRGTRLRVRAVSMQAADHPWILQMLMTRYLATWIVQREE